MKVLKYQLVLLVLCFNFSLEAQIDIGAYVQPTTNMLFIEGGTFQMGQGTAVPRRVTVSSFFIEATEVWNKDYRAFVAWMQKYEPQVKVAQLLPDTSLWARYIKGDVGGQLSKEYYRLKAFDYHPVVGVNWEQAELYCKWKTDRENKKVAIKEGFWTDAIEQKYKRFYTDEFLAGDYGTPSKMHLLPDFRLPSEAEWEYAAWGLIRKNNTVEEEIAVEQKFDYTSTAKSKKHFDKGIKKFRKEVETHAKKNPTPSYYNREKYQLPSHIFEGEVNLRGAFNMNDNVSEWAIDKYRKITQTNLSKNEPKVDPASVLEEYTTSCPPTKLHHKASIKKGDQSQFYTSTASFFNQEGKEITYQEFFQLKLKPTSPYQILEVDKNDNVYIKVLSKKEFEIYKEKEAKRLNEEFINKLNPLRVYKGANSGDKKGLIGPGHRFSEREIGPYNFPIGFRCGMTKIGN